MPRLHFSPLPSAVREGARRETINTLTRKQKRCSLQGFLVDWDAQKVIWDGLLSNEVLGVSRSRVQQCLLSSASVANLVAHPAV